MAELRIGDHEPRHPAVHELDPLQRRLGQERARQLAIHREHVDEPELLEPRAREADPVQRAARDLDVVGDLTGEIAGDPFALPLVAWEQALVPRLGQRLGKPGRQRL